MLKGSYQWERASTDMGNLFPPVNWHTTLLSLNNAYINRIAAPKNILVWPKIIDLRNFRFNSYQSEYLIMGQERSATSRDLPDEVWFPLWLSKGNMGGAYNPQPYEEVKRYLTRIGEVDAAVAVNALNLSLKELVNEALAL
ncbi:hypothetical protein [Paraburkholderia sp. BL10I2N1]|uniref:hypothetical protein n=1 Tax=Paraburkholderia sp. BL10I2N1 TaxID=1938796 RepID=UPI001061F9A1|nr:hypothetical protein [Paraburkholderia sp. BL10I2N1]TDN61315.1 hypothetical protein B0G77_4766 [Paraburkholderia sp. BL10I2N1]